MNYTRIRDLREERELTQTDIAKILKVAQRTYSGYENGTRGIPVELLIELALYYGVSVDYLLELTNIREAYPKDYKK